MRNPYYSLEAILRRAIPSVCTSGAWTRPAFAIVLDGEELIPEKIITIIKSKKLDQQLKFLWTITTVPLPIKQEGGFMCSA